MKHKYKKWIHDYIESLPGVFNPTYGRCQEATAKMAKEFPELTIVPGWANDHDHFWCVDPKGNIVDPTDQQFIKPIDYVPFTPGDEVCVGKCMNCGESIYKVVQTLSGYKESICGPKCHNEFANYLDKDMEEYKKKHPRSEVASDI